MQSKIESQYALHSSLDFLLHILKVSYNTYNQTNVHTSLQFGSDRACIGGSDIAIIVDNN